ncbi:RsmE family RNA methyltransferase [Rubellicoccus peritrichatus]|uniref:Ribosomal RNA small subunit methyltransferase E n=1 Tax=Rubellicoccus peritrichatus TaxID=3080537 RepID=A0AAQ3QVM1_9BACT|nr:RsmE family RNA methyltransferase [Puniceicoccus sp. CR14]WOO40952.1 RsmE family RNA methyltransferase [Puniceicoccus sp. CR14]
MNLILLEEADSEVVWPLDDSKTKHVLKVLRMTSGDEFFVGVVNGPRGKALIDTIEDHVGMRLEITWEDETPAANPIQLLVGLPRPQTSRRVLFESAVFGVEQLIFFQSDKGEPSYAQSTLWSGDEWQRHLREGAAQAFSTTIPEVVHCESLEAALARIPLNSKRSLCALDVYEGEGPLSSFLKNIPGAMLALGSERGWSARERILLRDAGFRLASLGERVLKTETACVAAMSVTCAALKRM